MFLCSTLLDFKHSATLIEESWLMLADGRLKWQIWSDLALLPNWFAHCPGSDLLSCAHQQPFWYSTALSLNSPPELLCILQALRKACSICSIPLPAIFGSSELSLIETCFIDEKYKPPPSWRCCCKTPKLGPLAQHAEIQSLTLSDGGK